MTFSKNFSGAVTLTIPASEHGFDSASLVVQAYDDQPTSALLDAEVTIHSTTFEVNVTFASPKNGRLVIVGPDPVVAGVSTIAGLRAKREKLLSRIASAIRSIQAGDKSVSYQSVEEMKAAIEVLDREIAKIEAASSASSTANTRTSLATFSRGC